MTPSQRCIDLIHSSEGYRTTAYWDPTGKRWTIGYGETHGVKEGDVWTREQIDIALMASLMEAAAIVLSAVKRPLTQGQLDALTDFVFNEGPGKKGVKDGFVVLKNGDPSTMLTAINFGDFKKAADEFPKWNKSGGVVLPGLVTRRKKEQALFLS